MNALSKIGQDWSRLVRPAAAGGIWLVISAGKLVLPEAETLFVACKGFKISVLQTSEANANICSFGDKQFLNSIRFIKKFRY